MVEYKLTSDHKLHSNGIHYHLFIPVWCLLKFILAKFQIHINFGVAGHSIYLLSMPSMIQCPLSANATSSLFTNNRAYMT